MRQAVLADHDSVASGPAGPLCRCCGKPVPEGGLAWDYPVPGPVAFLPGAARRTVFRSQRIISVTGLGNFICVILPVPAGHDREATPGIWLAVPGQREWQRVIDAGRQGGDAPA